MRRTIMMGAAAALAVAAHQANAQGSGSPLPGTDPQTPPATTPPATTPPATTPPTTTTPPAAGTTPPAAGTADPTTLNTIEEVHHLNGVMMTVGKMAAERGTTSNVKQYGERIASEHQRLDSELTQIAQRRGIQLRSAEQITQELNQSNFLAPLAGKSGIEFDRAVMDLLVSERESRVPQLKQLRDRTPGRDAELKKWLDETEVLMEKTRNEARDVRQAVRQEQQKQQRQGRKP
jgi:putative membrane protein